MSIYLVQQQIQWQTSMNELQKQVLLNRQIRVEITQTLVTVPDKRYRCLISLMRSDRPRYWRFRCFNDGCNSIITEIQNLEVYAVDDFYDPQNINNTGIGRHCKGTLPDGTPCHYSYFFNVQQCVTLTVVETTKNCNKCQKIIPIEGFYKYTIKGRNGVMGTCKKCRNIQQMIWNKAQEYGSHSWCVHQLAKMKSRANKKNIDFGLDLDFLKWLYGSLKVCEYCKRIVRPTFDRKDNSGGYVPDNLVISCLECNVFRKDALTYHEMLLIGEGLRAVYDSRLQICVRM